MTQFQECINDLKKWEIPFDEGYFYDDDDYETGLWISIRFGDNDDCMSFDLDGNFQGWI